MATIPIYNPKCPFLGQIPNKLRIGSSLKIRARLHGPHNRLNINIQKGAALRPRDDSILHLSIRGDERIIVRNIFKDQNWGTEERYGGFPIHGTASFEVTIMAEHSQFRISINGAHYCTYNYRMPIDQAEYVSIDGQGVIESITIDPSFHSGHHGHHRVHPVAPIQHIPPVHQPTIVRPSYPGHSYPAAPPPPPMPMPAYPPPYPGLYPNQATPYSEKTKTSVKLAAGAGIIAGITAISLASASRNLRRRKC